MLSVKNNQLRAPWWGTNEGPCFCAVAASQVFLVWHTLLSPSSSATTRRLAVREPPVREAWKKKAEQDGFTVSSSLGHQAWKNGAWGMLLRRQKTPPTPTFPSHKSVLFSRPPLKWKGPSNSRIRVRESGKFSKERLCLSDPSSRDPVNDSCDFSSLWNHIMLQCYTTMWEHRKLF